MKPKPVQWPEDEEEVVLLLPRCTPRYTPSYHHNVRAVPQLGEHDRDHFGPYPMVTLRGAWLRTFGFEVGVHVKIEATPGQILLRPLWNDDPPVRENAKKPVVRYVEVEDR
ncbi:SymE family type I addiction module toxin [Stenotrophomonas sp. AB1(2024)]|jgi:toxic protein SymE|uniref:SymE family type I addiction module toxin n=1 Tax=Stenotrophomonas sp. AB1(2024) TaxID=3132215 RepID=UPI0030A554CB